MMNPSYYVKMKGTLVYLFLLLIFDQSKAVKFQIYKDFDYTGLIFESDAAAPGCTNVPEYGQGTAGSVQTDGCVIIYENIDCGGLSMKLVPKTPDLEKLMKPIYSYHQCNSTHGGDKIRVELFHEDQMLGEYIDTCECQNIPPQIYSNANRLFNHHNCVKIYSAEGCSGKSQELSPGKSTESENLRQFGSYVRSISACGERPACVKLHSKIFRFVLRYDDKDAADDSGNKNVELAAKTTFYNNGSATVRQEYRATKTLRLASSIERSKTLTETSTYTTENTIAVDVSVSLPKAPIEVSGGVGLTTAHSNSESTETSEGETFTSIEEKSFTVAQIIEVPPCSEYVVSSSVSVKENFPIEYDVYAKISGIASGKQMTAEEVIENVSEMTFVEIYDEHTAVFMSTHNMIVNVGVDALITGEGTIIENCLTRESKYLENVMPVITKNSLKIENK